MSDADAARNLLRELLAEALANGNGQSAAVPPPPVAAVHRPSTWSQPAAPGEVIGESPSGDSLASSLREHRGDGAGRIELVRLESDADLERFARAVVARAAADGAAIMDGRLRFTLGRAATATSGAVRVERGAVTERTVKQAAEAGGRLVLGAKAVLTPLAREKARALGVDIERER
jgi:hypothetical protein